MIFLGKEVKLRTQDVKRDKRGKALLDLLDGGGSGQMMNQYGQPFNPLGGLNQKMQNNAYQLMGGPFNPLASTFARHMY